MRFHAMAAALLAAAAQMATPARAEFPDRPIRLVIPLPPGGSNDIIGRVVGNGMAARLGQPVIVENRSGASGMLGAQAVARAAADGHTVLLAGGAFTVNNLIRADLPYDPAADFAPIGLIGSTAIAVFVHPSVPAHNLRELQAAARQARPLLHFASSGIGTTGHAAGLMLNLVLGVEMDHVSYRGSGPVLNDLLAGRVQVYPVVLAPMLSYIRAGSLRAVAVSGARRNASAPELSTAAEQGFPEFSAENWYGLMTTGGTPPAHVATLFHALAAALADPDVRTKLQEAGLDVTPSGSPQDFARYLADDVARWQPVIRSANVHLE
ncbi:MAG TPA: tripartite tricarboxylate transporter substrate-binding protein [Roseomonas sp.]